MEFDILNEILTGTVAQLFTDLHKHANFMKTSSQMGQDKSEIPKSADVPLLSGRIEDATPLQQWLMIDAKGRLSDTMQKLGLDAYRISGKHLASYGVDELQMEKKKVKNELKYYDQAFIQRFNRAPSRTEKEPMRQIYMYYKRLKQYLTKAQASGNGRTNATASVSGGARSYSAGDRLVVDPNTVVLQQQQQPRGVSAGGQSVVLSAGYSDDGGEESKRGEDKVAVIVQPRGRSTGTVVVTDPPEVLDPKVRVQQENQTLMKKFGVKNFTEAQKKYLDMKQERRELRARLDRFQRDFEQTNNRKIRYTRDIAPVANDFKRYKEMKGDLLKLEVLVQALSTSAT